MMLFCIGDYEYELVQDGKASVKVIDKNKKEYAPIPQTVEYKGILYTVTDVSYCFWECSSLAEAPAIPNGVMDMGDCFYGCSSLVKAPAIPDSVTDMGSCFEGCTALVEAPVIPDRLTHQHISRGSKG